MVLSNPNCQPRYIGMFLSGTLVLRFCFGKDGKFRERNINKEVNLQLIEHPPNVPTLRHQDDGALSEWMARHCPCRGWWWQHHSFIARKVCEGKGDLGDTKHMGLQAAGVAVPTQQDWWCSWMQLHSQQLSRIGYRACEGDALGIWESKLSLLSGQHFLWSAALPRLARAVGEALFENPGLFTPIVWRRHPVQVFLLEEQLQRPLLAAL